MSAFVVSELASGLKATNTLSPMPTKAMVSKLLWSLRLMKLMIVPTMAHAHIKQNKVNPQ